MRIFNRDEDKSLNYIEIYLTKEEIEEMIGRLNGIVERESGEHSDFLGEYNEDTGFKKEILLVKYDKDQLEDFDKRSKELIMYDK